MVKDGGTLEETLMLPPTWVRNTLKSLKLLYYKFTIWGEPLLWGAVSVESSVLFLCFPIFNYTYVAFSRKCYLVLIR